MANEQRQRLLSFKKSPNPLVPFIAEGRTIINPQFAEHILETMNFERQRTANTGHVMALAEVMLNGDWQGGHSIHFAKFNRKTILVDGQHRLRAVVMSGKKQDFNVVVHPCRSENEVSLLFCTFDTNNRKRSAADVMQAYGVSGSGLARQMTQSLYEAAFLVENNFVRLGRTHHDAKNVRLRLECVGRWLGEASMYQSAVKGADSYLKGKLLSSGCIAVGLVTFRHQQSLANNFWCRVADGDGIRKGDPRYALAYDLRNRGLHAGSLSIAENVCSLAWNAFFNNSQRKIIKIPQNYRFTLLGTPWSR